MAAIALAKTKVIAFARNKRASDVKGLALIKAKTAIQKALLKHKRGYFVGVVEMQEHLEFAPNPFALSENLPSSRLGEL